MALPICEASASSVLHDDEEAFGAHFAIDGRADTLWNSAGGAAQRLSLRLAARARVRAVELVFQGGFVGQELEVTGSAAGSSGGAGAAAPPLLLGRFQPRDCNERQRFELGAPAEVDEVALHFAGSTDFYGRIVLYSVELF